MGVAKPITYTEPQIETTEAKRGKPSKYANKMDFIEPILAIAEKLYALCGEVKANKQRCRRLMERVSTLVDLVRAVRTNGLGEKAKVVERGLKELKLTLESAQEVVRKYACSTFLKRIARAYAIGEEFSSLSERLSDAQELLTLALQVEQRERFSAVFDEVRRSKEDEEDRQKDSQELMELITSVHDTVDQTQKDVQEIKSMLESSKNPSIHMQEIREIRLEELTIDPPQPFMKSDHAEVYKGEYNKFAVVIKRYTCPVTNSPGKVRSIFHKDVETMKRFESPNILRMFGICVQDEDGPCPNYLIVMEFCEKGNLRELLDSKCNLPWERKARMSLDAAQGLYRLHQSEEIFKVHGCINSYKFLVAAGYRVKLGGFELAKTETSLRKTKNNRFSSLWYSSPQQLQNINHRYDRACEIYSFGIVLWEIATRCKPFEGCSNDEVYQKVCDQGFTEPLPQDCPSQLGDLINACRSFESFQRPTAGVLVDKLRKVVEMFGED